MTRLPDHPMRARRVDGPQDGAHVVRIFDPVQHHEERNPVGGGDEFLDAQAFSVANVRDDALMGAALRETIELTGVRAAHGNSLAGRQPSDLGVALVAPCRNPQGGHASRAKGLEHGVDAVNAHSRSGYRPSAAANAVARSRLPTTVGSPAERGRFAPRSMAGIAKSSSGPSLRPVSATRMG